jgi:hypothetical protein
MNYKMQSDIYFYRRLVKARFYNTDRKMIQPSDEGNWESVPSISLSRNVISYFNSDSDSDSEYRQTKATIRRKQHFNT